MTTHSGIIGCGMMGQEHLRNIALLEDAFVKVIYEPDPEMAARALQLAPRAVLAENIDSLLAHDQLDCLLIASPNFCHVDQLEAIAARVSLPILVEKPLFTDPADWQVEAFKVIIARLSGRDGVSLHAADAAVSVSAESATGESMLTIVEHRYPFLQKVGNWNRFNRNSGGTLVEKCCHFFDQCALLEIRSVRVMASAGQMVNHLDETYEGETPDIWDCGYVLVDFASGARAALELAMFADGSQFQEMIHAVGSEGKLEVKVPGPARLWTGPQDRRPVAQLIDSPRAACNPVTTECPVDETILAAGDHNGSTYYQHQKFLEVVRCSGGVEVTLDDGIWAVRMGQAAQSSATNGQAVLL